MKGFFDNLIDRHQGRVETVAPRARSYFEEEPRSVEPEVVDLSKTTVQAEPDHPVAARPISNTAQSEAQDKGALETNWTTTSVQSMPVTGSYSHLSCPGRQQGTEVKQVMAGRRNTVRPGPETNWRTHQADTSSGSEHANEAIHRSETPTPVSDSMLDTNQRIDAVLNRLQGALKLQSGNETANTRQDVLERPQDDLASAGRKADVSPGLLIDGPVPSVGTGIVETSDQNVGSEHSRNQNNPNRGDLEIPAWLRQKQTEFNSKNAQINQSSEPVVNVSIGRVEVRAVRETKPQPGSSRRKPSGVMSLDEYLSKRQRKGVV
jgi:hypothetical protein